MKVAIVHDDLVQWGGAERVLETLIEIYPDAPIYTAVFDYKNKALVKRFGSKKIHTSFLQKIPGWKKLYKPLFFLYPIAFEQFDLTGFDLVISHTTRFAKCIITRPETKHICYCHTPPRFLWNFSGEKVPRLARLLIPWLRNYDKISANRVDLFLAGSKNAAERIKKIYHQDPKVVYPFVDLNRFENVVSFNGGYFVVVSRLNKYKRVELAIKACMKLGVPLKIIGTGSEFDNLSGLLLRQLADRNDDSVSNIEFLGDLSDEMVVRVMSGCKALIVPGIEDFGITPLEAEALGKPVIAFGQGGALETVIENKTGLFFQEQTVESLVEKIQKLDSLKLNPNDSLENARRFSKENFILSFRAAVRNL